MQSITWEDYSRSVEQRFKQKPQEYEAANRKLAERRGLVRRPHKYSPANFGWFVLYQFAGLSSGDVVKRITSKNSGDDSTVLKGVKAAAKLIGWKGLRELSK